MLLLREKLEALKLLNIDDKLNKFKLFYNLTIETNKKFNLTTIISINDFETKHFIDSLESFKFLNGEILDIGAGAGFPSIPLAIVREDLNFTLVESVGKKANFLIEVKEKLALNNIEIKKNRIEEFKKDKRYDTIVARAVAPLNTLLEYSLPFLKLDGNLIAYKGENYNEELKEAQNALTILGGELEKIYNYNLNINKETQKRSLIIIKKTKETNPKYPRKGNKARLKPL